jgi:xylitol oxidase
VRRRGATALSSRRTNWGGNVVYDATMVAEPTSVGELQELVAGSERVHALGSRHSFNGIADTSGVHISLGHLTPHIHVQTSDSTADVSAWATYGDIGQPLHARGLALPAMASLPHISIAGACATATHGSGMRNRNLAAMVVGMEFVDGTGARIRRSRADHAEEFPGLPVHLGALGVVTQVTLQLVEAAPVHQRAWVDLPAHAWLDHFDDIMSAAHSVSCFTRWRDDLVDTVLHKAVGDPDDDPVDVFGAARAAGPRHPVVGADSANLTAQQGRPGPWHERLPHFRPDVVPGGGEELQSEWYVPYERGVEAVAAMFGVGDRIADVLLTSEVRTIAADDLWLSPAYERDVVAIHLTWSRDVAAVHRAVDVVERALAPFDPVPHWGKLSHAGRSDWARGFPRLDDFAALARAHDPVGRFRNDFLDAYVL